MNTTPAAIRKQQERGRKRNAGMVLVQEWVHRDCAARLKRYAERLRKDRDKGMKKLTRCPSR